MKFNSTKNKIKKIYEDNESDSVNEGRLSKVYGNFISSIVFKRQRVVTLVDNELQSMQAGGGPAG